MLNCKLFVLVSTCKYRLSPAAFPVKVTTCAEREGVTDSSVRSSRISSARERNSGFLRKGRFFAPADVPKPAKFPELHGSLRKGGWYTHGGIRGHAPFQRAAVPNLGEVAPRQCVRLGRRRRARSAQAAQVIDNNEVVFLQPPIEAGASSTVIPIFSDDCRITPCLALDKVEVKIKNMTNRCQEIKKTNHHFEMDPSSSRKRRS